MHHAGPDTSRNSAAAPLAAAPAGNGWPPSVLAGIERELARFVGPLAATLVRRAAQQHGTIDTLIAALLPSIEGQQDRDAFARTCSRRAVMRNAPAAPAPAPAPTALPAQRRSAAPPAAAARAGTTLLRAADELLGVLPRLRNLATLSDPAALRLQLLQRLATFEAEAAAAALAAAHCRRARPVVQLRR